MGEQVRGPARMVGRLWQFLQVIQRAGLLGCELEDVGDLVRRNTAPVNLQSQAPSSIFLLDERQGSLGNEIVDGRQATQAEGFEVPFHGVVACFVRDLVEPLDELEAVVSGRRAVEFVDAVAPSEASVDVVGVDILMKKD